jgi:hypothetical protein
MRILYLDVDNSHAARTLLKFVEDRSDGSSLSLHLGMNLRVMKTNNAPGEAQPAKILTV